MSTSTPQLEAGRTEANLIEAVRGGDEHAFGELYARYGGEIFGFVLATVRDRSRAEDITQDAFVSALRRMRESDAAIAFKPWIYQIARNACIDEFRRLRRRQEVPIEDGPGEGERTPVSLAPSPQAYVEHRQELSDLGGAFRGLSDRQHEVIVLRELEGLSYEQIATRTGMTLAMVESTLLRARRRLGEEYEDITSGRRCLEVREVIDEAAQVSLSALGIRARRRFDRHLAHCQPCRRYAHLAGLELPSSRMPRVVRRLAGLLPFPFLRLWRERPARPTAAPRHGWRLAQPLRRAAQLAHPSAAIGASPSFAAAVTAIVIAGTGAVATLEAQPGSKPGTARPASIGITRTDAGRAAPAQHVRATHSRSSSRAPTGSPRTSTTQQARRNGQAPAASASASHSQPSAPSSRRPVTVPSPPTSPPTSPSSLPKLPASKLPRPGRLLHKLPSPLRRILGVVPVAATRPGGRPPPHGG